MSHIYCALHLDRCRRTKTFGPIYTLTKTPTSSDSWCNENYGTKLSFCCILSILMSIYCFFYLGWLFVFISELLRSKRLPSHHHTTAAEVILVMLCFIFIVVIRWVLFPHFNFIHEIVSAFLVLRLLVCPLRLSFNVNRNECIILIDWVILVCLCSVDVATTNYLMNCAFRAKRLMKR